MNELDELRESSAGASADTIVLDPPAFAKNKASVGKALSGQGNQPVKRFAPGGFHYPQPYNVGEAAFADVRRRRRRCARGGRRRREAHAERSSGAGDRIETYYLKCLPSKARVGLNCEDRYDDGVRGRFTFAGAPSSIDAEGATLHTRPQWRRRPVPEPPGKSRYRAWLTP